MALITCPECEGKVSDQAVACPHCGAPIKRQSSMYFKDQNRPQQQTQRNTPHPKAVSPTPQTIEKTGKGLKALQLGSCLFLVSGAVITCGVVPAASKGDPGAVFTSGLFFFFIGVIWSLIVKFLTWWHHG